MENQNGSTNVSTKVNFFKSMSLKLSLIVIVSVFIAIVANCLFSIPMATNVAEGAFRDYITSETDSLTLRIDDDLENGISLEDSINDVLPTLNIDGSPTAYAFIIDEDATLLYHKEASKIGTVHQEEFVQNIGMKMKAGQKIDNGSEIYTINGDKRIAGYSSISTGHMVFVTAEYEDMLSEVNSMRNTLILVAVGCLVLAAIIGFFSSKIITNPINKPTEIIRRITSLDLRPSEFDEALCKRGDELGVMSRAMRVMRATTKDIIVGIDEAAINVADNVNQLQEITDVVNDMCSDNSATTEELAAGMEETSASTITINGNLENMQADAQEIDAMTVEGDKLSEEIMDRATELKNTTVTATNKTIKMYEVVKEKANDAIEGTKSVQRINDLTDTIMSISSQTSLLALNASIEAARAGEAGKGFAVVATEIGNLANQTSAAVSNINGIVGEVNTAVKNISECLTETTQFLEASVLVDYKEFEKVSDQYRMDAESFKKSMQDVRNGVESLNTFINQVVDASAGIGTTINEAATGVSDIAIKTSDMVNKTSETAVKVEDCHNTIKKLDAIVERFILD